MAQLVVGLAGAAIGSAFGAPGIGWAIGASIGGMVGPRQRTEGPRLSDLKVTAAEYGAPIPVIYGHPRTAGVIVWASDKREIATTTRQGKGGGPENTSYTYEVDLLYLLSANIIAGVRRIWADGKLVYSIADASDEETIAASEDAVRWRALRVYSGAEDQLPDPTYEAAVGVGNAPAYRGRGTIMLEGVQLGSGGQLPNLTFEVLQQADITERRTQLLYHFFSAGLADQSGFGTDLTAQGRAGILQEGVGLHFSPTGAVDATNYVRTTVRAANVYGGPSPYTLQCFVTPQAQTAVESNVLNLSGPESHGGLMIRYHSAGRFGVYVGNASGLFWSPNNYPQGREYHLCVMKDGRGAALWINGVRVTGFLEDRPWTNGYVCFGTQLDNAFTPMPNYPFAGVISAFKLTDAKIYPDSFAPPDRAMGLDSSLLGLLPDALDAVLTDLCARCGVPASDVDVTSLAGQQVHAMAVQPTSARAVLEQLATAYYFECVESDKLYFRRRGAAPVATIPYGDYGADGLLTLQDANDLELPAQVNVSYLNLSNAYQQGNEVSDRITTDSTAVSSVQLGMGLTPAVAKAIADTAVLDQTNAARAGSATLDVRYARLEPIDVVLLTDSAGLQHRARIVKIADADGARSLDLVADDARVLRELGITSDDYDDDYTVMPLADTDLVILDIPLLRDQDDNAGLYAAGDGLRGRWPGYLLLRDGTEVGRSATGAAMGVVAEALGNWASLLVDESSIITVTVNPGDELVSITHADLATSTANYAAIGAPGRWEIVQYQRAVLASEGVYRVSGLARGRLGTEHLRGTHQAGDRFVALDGAGLLRDVGNVGDLGIPRTYKAVTQGARIDDGTTVTATPTWQGLRPLSPVGARQLKQGNGDIVLQWGRRSRYVGNVLMGVLPLGEAAEAYEVEILNGAVVRRTLPSNTPAVTYTQAQQVADFGSEQATVSVRIYQLSASIGRGQPASL